MRDLAFDIRANDRTGQIFDQIKAKANDSFRNVDSAIARLNSKFDAGYRNSLEFARGLRDVDRALAQNKIGMNEAERLIASMTTRLGTSVNASDLAAKGQDRLAAAVRGANASLAAQQRQIDSVAAAGRGFTAANNNLNTANIAAQFQDIAVTASMGMSPVQIALQQGTQLQAILGPMGAAGAAKALGASLLSLATPVSLVTLGLTGAAAAAIGYFSEWVTRSEDSVEALEKQRDLIGSVAARWGDALPAVKAYVDEAKRLKEIDDALEAGQLLGNKQFDSVRREMNVVGADLSDVIQQMEQLGAKPSGLANLQREFAELEKAILDNKATAQDALDVQLALDESLLGRSNPAVQALAAAFGDLAEQIRKASGEADKFRMPPQIGDRFDQGRDEYGRDKYSLLSRLDPLNGFRSTPFMNEEDLMFERSRQERLRREAQGMPVPKLRGIDDVPGEVDFMGDIVRESEIRLRQLEIERGALGLTGSALAAYRYEQEMLLQAVRQGIDLGPDQIATIDRIAEAYGKQFDAVQKMQDQQRAMESAILGHRQGFRGLADDIRQVVEAGGDLSDVLRTIGLRLADSLFDAGIEGLGKLLFPTSKDPGGAGGGLNAIIGSVFGSVARRPANDNAAAGDVMRDVARDVFAAPVEAVTRAPLRDITAAMGGLRYINDNATRNLRLTESLEAKIREAVGSVYGEGAYASVYSGGQPGIGSGLPRVGSTRHDFGHAGDLRIFDSMGRQVTGDALAPLAQFWQAKGYGGTGLEMRGGGIHLDEHADRAPFWSYGNMTRGQRSAIEAGQKGMFPELANSATQATKAIDAMATTSIGATKGLGTFGQSLMNMFPSAPEAPGFNFASLFGGGSNLFTGLLSGFNPLGPMTGLFARGGVFDMGNVVPFAAGGVVGGPTLFPMSGGRTGMMGEAGIEAIVPLARGRDGRLGVRMETGWGQSRPAINIRPTVINNNGSQVRVDAEEDENGDINIQMIVDGAVARNVNRKGSQTERAFRQRGVRQPRRVR